MRRILRKCGLRIGSGRSSQGSERGAGSEAGDGYEEYFDDDIVEVEDEGSAEPPALEDCSKLLQQLNNPAGVATTAQSVQRSGTPPHSNPNSSSAYRSPPQSPFNQRGYSQQQQQSPPQQEQPMSPNSRNRMLHNIGAKGTRFPDFRPGSNNSGGYENRDSFGSRSNSVSSTTSSLECRQNAQNQNQGTSSLSSSSSFITQSGSGSHPPRKDWHVYDPVFGVIPEETRDLWTAQEEESNQRKQDLMEAIKKKKEKVPPIRFRG